MIFRLSMWNAIVSLVKINVDVRTGEPGYVPIIGLISSIRRSCAISWEMEELG